MFAPELERMSRDQLERLQEDRLKQTVKRLYGNCAPYRKKMDDIGMKPEDVRSLADLRLLPFTVKTDLRDHYPFGMFSASQKDIVRIHASSGTTGKPTVVGYTKNDIETWAELMARSLAAAGGHSLSLVQNAYGYGLFTGGLGAHYGAERLGAAVLPISGGNTQRQVMLMKDFGATMLTCTPSYALHLAETILAMGIDPKKDLRLESGVFGAEPWTDGMRKQIEAMLGIRAHDIYGLSEIMGPGVAVECEQQCKLHVWEDHFIPEIIDPDTLEPLPMGEKGELVITTITKEGIPLIRYRTRDITSLDASPCACGRTHIRIERVTGRSDDMLIIRGVNVFPSQIETILTKFSEVEPHYLIVVDRVNNLDELQVCVEMSSQLFSDEIRAIEGVRARIVHELRSVLGLGVDIKLVEPKTIERSEGKAKRVLDKRAGK